MKTRYYQIIYALTIPVFLSVMSCNKFLDEKSDKKLVVISTIKDCQALLDEHNTVNYSDPAVGEVSADNYYLLKSDYDNLSETFQRMHIWGDNLFIGISGNDWLKCYNVVYVANTVLENLDKVKREPNDQEIWNDVKGQALVHRGRSFLSAVILWSLAYDENSASSDLGIPLRLTSDFNEPSVRATVEQSYQQIIQDFKTSISLLPSKSINPLRPSKAAAYSLLARTYLAMRKYDLAKTYADSALMISNELLDFNDSRITKTGNNPAFANIGFNSNPSNPELIFQARASTPTPLANSRARIDSLLYNSYQEGDLRKKVFFRALSEAFSFRGGYDGSSALFTGCATDELYLTRAECAARSGDKERALSDINTLLEKRWDNSVLYTPVTAQDANEALEIVLQERRKELLMRPMIRWMDIKRLNKEGANISIKRILDGQTFTLEPNDLRFALPLPEDIVAISGMPQNPR